MSEVAQPALDEQEPTPPKSPEKPVTSGTAYLVLSSAGNKGWVEQTTVDARSNTEAIRKFLGGASEPDGTYVAVPARSWKPVVVKVETSTKLKLA